MRISDWSSDVCSSDLFAQSVGLGEAAKGAMLGRGEPHRLGAGAHRAAPGEMLFAIAGNGGIMPFLRSCVWRDAISIPSNPQKSWMHPCVRCVSELLARCVASQPRNLSFRATGSGMNLFFRSGLPRCGYGDACAHSFVCERG